MSSEDIEFLRDCIDLREEHFEENQRAFQDYTEEDVERFEAACESARNALRKLAEYEGGGTKFIYTENNSQ